MSAHHNNENSHSHNGHETTTTHVEHHAVGPWQLLVESDLLNVLVLALAIAYLGNKFIPKMIDERKKQISKELNNAKEAREKAEKELKDVEEKCKNLSQELEQIKNDAKKSASGMEKAIEEETEAELDKIRVKAKKEIENARLEAIQSIQDSASDSAMKIAEEALIKIAENPNIQNKLIDDFIDEIDKPSKN